MRQVFPTASAPTTTHFMFWEAMRARSRSSTLFNYNIYKKLELVDRKILFDITKFCTVKTNNLTPDYLDNLIAEYIHNKQNIYYVVLWPCANEAYKQLIKKLSGYGKPLYVKHYELSYKGMCKFICLLYHDHNRDSVNKIINHKMCNITNDDICKISVVIFDNFMNTDIAGTCAPHKTKLREHISKCINNNNNNNNNNIADLLHINDTNEQTILYTKFILNDSLFGKLCND